MEFVDQAEQPTANVLLYGPPKTGKTTGAATAPGKLLYVNCELPNAMLNARKINPSIQVPKFPVSEEGIIQPMKLLAEISNGYEEWDTVVIDPVGELYRLMLEEVSGRALHPRIDQRGTATTQLERFIRYMCEMPVNFIIVCHEMQDNTEDGVIAIPFSGSKSGSQSGLGPRIAGMVDIIGYTAVVETEDGEKKYMAQLVNAKGRQGGDRFDVLGTFRDLNLAEWFIEAGIKGSSTEKEKV